MKQPASEDRWGFDDWAKTYDEDVAEAAQTDDWMFHDYHRVLDQVVELCELSESDCPTVLDIGVGTGNLASRFVDRGLTVIGIDPSLEMRRICQLKHGRVQVKEGHFLKIPLPSKSIDLLVSSYAFHHVEPEHVERTVAEIKRVLKPRGRIVIADLMFRNRADRERVMLMLRQSGRETIAEELDEEYPALVDELSRSFRRVGFTLRSRQLTPSTWAIAGHL